MKARVLKALLAVCVLGGVMAGDAAAATGDLIQKPGALGCLSAVVAGCSPGTALTDPESVTVSPDARNAYVASSASASVAIFDRGLDGTLTQKAGTAGCVSDTGAGPCVDGTALDGARSVTISPDGLNAYVASSVSGAVAVFDRAANGVLTQKAGLAGCVGAAACGPGVALAGAASVTISPNGQTAYVASSGSDAVAVFDRAANGVLTQKAGTAGCVSDTGAGPCVDGTALDGARSVTVSPDGQSAYVASFDSNAVAVFDRAADGVLTQKLGLAGCIADGGAPCGEGRALDDPAGVTVSPDGRTVYLAASTNDAVVIFDRAPNGTLTQKAGPAGCILVTGPGVTNCADGDGVAGALSVAVSADGRSAYVAGSQSFAVALFDRALDGTLTQSPFPLACISESGVSGCSDGNALINTSSVALSPDGRSAYLAAIGSDAVAVFDREPVSAPPPPADTTKPVVRGLSVSPARFRAARKGPSITTRRVGARVSYRLSEAATVSFRVERALKGKRVRGRCVKPKRSNRRAKGCTRYKLLRGRFSHDGEAGSNKFRFSGRLRGRKLAPGKYRLRAVATDGAGNKSVLKRDRFRILRP